MQHLEVSCAVRPIKWPLGVKWLNTVYAKGEDQFADWVDTLSDYSTSPHTHKTGQENIQLIFSQME